jgi:ClpP class serine protease
MEITVDVSTNGASTQDAVRETDPAKAKDDLDSQIAEIDEEIEQQAAKLAGLLDNIPYFLLLQLATRGSIDFQFVDEVYEGLREKFPDGSDRLMVVLSSAGGDIDAAYNIAMLFRRYAQKRLIFVVPRIAKSAATLLACAGDEILFTPVAELGPLDPQITEINPLERRVERFSPLHIQGSLELIADLYKQKKGQLADALVQRLQFPLTLGSYRQTLKISRTYLTTLLETRMLKDDPEEGKAGRIAKRFAEGYADHSACILCEETNDCGLKTSLLSGDAEVAAWGIHRLERRKHKLLREKKKQENLADLSHLPPELLELLQGGATSGEDEPPEEESP